MSETSATSTASVRGWSTLRRLTVCALVLLGVAVALPVLGHAIVARASSTAVTELGRGDSPALKDWLDLGLILLGHLLALGGILLGWRANQNDEGRRVVLADLGRITLGLGAIGIATSGLGFALTVLEPAFFMGAFVLLMLAGGPGWTLATVGLIFLLLA